MAGKTEEKKGFIVTRWFRALYNWVMHWAETPYAEPMLGALSFAESSFFPIPPDVLLIPMAISRQDRAIRFGAITSVTSVLGGMMGYLIGLMFFDTVGIKIIEFYGVLDKYYLFREWFEQYNFAIIMVAGLTPLPYKVFTITAGVAQVNFPIFVLGSVLSRSTRFMAEGVVCHHGDWFSDKIFKMPIREALDKYINWFAIGMAALGVAGFMLVKVVLPSGEVNLSEQFTAADRSVTVGLESRPAPADAAKFNYYLSLELDGATSGFMIEGGPFPKPAKGDAELFGLSLPGGELIVAPVIYADLASLSPAPGDPSPPMIAGTDGMVRFYLLSGGRLQPLTGFEFPRYRLMKTGNYTEGKIDPMTAGASEIEAVVKLVEHNGFKDEQPRAEERKYRFRFAAGRLEPIE